jgi:hypothetical protein
MYIQDKNLLLYFIVQKDKMIRHKFPFLIHNLSSESVNRRRIYNTIAKRKEYKRASNYLQKLTYKTKDRVTLTPLKTHDKKNIRNNLKPHGVLLTV